MVILTSEQKNSSRNDRQAMSNKFAQTKNKKKIQIFTELLSLMNHACTTWLELS